MSSRHENAVRSRDGLLGPQNTQCHRYWQLCSFPQSCCHSLSRTGNLLGQYVIVLSLDYRLGGISRNRLEALDVAGPDLTITLKPRRAFGERFALDPARASLPITPARNQASAREHLQVLRYRRLAHRNWLRQLGHRRITRGDPGEDRPARWIRERGEGGIELIGRRHFITFRFDNNLVIDSDGGVVGVSLALTSRLMF
jgi:hypothetical protein